MIIPQNYTYNYDLEISNDECEIINKFLSFYKSQSVIVADRYRQDFSMVPLEDDSIIFKINENEWKCIDFCKRIFYKGKPYVVELDLRSDMRDDLRCVYMHEFKIITNGEVHLITLDTEDIIKRNILFSITNIFDEKKIISPEQAYSKQMYIDKPLQGFIRNHEWKNIGVGIQQMPELANALFIIGEGFESNYRYIADFGTILYQLILFRMNNLSDFDEKDLRELDKLILKLSKTKLLKVQFHENISCSESWPTSSILLQSNNYNGRVHMSQQYTTDNTELLKEQKILNKCLKNLMPK